ncbi:DUF3570 domain-containing protein [Ramlibacter sp. GTP1]|uniref:DUF3570 domain-containing protein n=2 Tax=Ramlibacter albus TaxID=2079448 RepID=A0A923M8H8_9BURK|nr:DUF3570 domain-containing protein [Ramlibacter albus]MBC5764724.1 DUF3570 domain-containing protein [Ramlibacter albus]
MVLPGLAAVSGAARAEEAPAQGVVALKYGHYEDSQPGLDRIRVRSPHVYVMAPIAGKWSLEGSHVVDSVSGATPRLHTFTTGATRMTERRKATDVKVTRYFPRASVSGTLAYSDERDYESKAAGLEARFSTDDNNRTFIVGLGHAEDRIDTTGTGGSVRDRHRRTTELQLGLTQVLTPDDTAQFLYTRVHGRGYYDDPYKDFDRRPDRRDADILLARWNRHVERFDAALRVHWRYYRDGFGVRAHTLGAEWAQPLASWTITPGLRWYRQTAADFWFAPVADATGRLSDLETRRFAIRLTGLHSADARLAAFHAWTVSLKLAYDFNADNTVDFKVDHYRTSPGAGLDPLRARFLQLGYTHRF